MTRTLGCSRAASHGRASLGIGAFRAHRPSAGRASSHDTVGTVPTCTAAQRPLVMPKDRTLPRRRPAAVWDPGHGAYCTVISESDRTGPGRAFIFPNRPLCKERLPFIVSRNRDVSLSGESPQRRGVFRGRHGLTVHFRSTGMPTPFYLGSAVLAPQVPLRRNFLNNKIEEWESAWLSIPTVRCCSAVPYTDGQHSAASQRGAGVSQQRAAQCLLQQQLPRRRSSVFNHVF